jgi:hypothetical protein
MIFWLPGLNCFRPIRAKPLLEIDRNVVGSAAQIEVEPRRCRIDPLGEANAAVATDGI